MMSTEPLRHTVFPPHGGGLEAPARGRELAERVRALCVLTAGAVGKPSAVPRPDDFAEPAELVSALTGACLDRLSTLDDPDGPVAERLCRVVLASQQLALDLYEHGLRAQSRRLAECSAGLSRMRSLPTSGGLLDAACVELVRRCGFGRAVLSRVEDRVWKPWMAHFRDDNAVESWFGDWVDQGIPLGDRTPETRLLAERRPAIVYDTENATVYRPIIVESGHSKSYVVAPLLNGTSVVGFLHADHYPTARRVDDVDRDVLWAFAEGFGHIYERTVLMERVRAQRDRVGQIVSSALTMMSELSTADLGLEPVGHEHVASSVYSRLTDREAEVLRLMTEGGTNRAIARRLVIAEDTVKSHVKHILRKLGVANRSQAVALALAPG